MPEPKEWVTVKEAAVLVGKSARTIYEWIEDNRLASHLDSQGRMVVLSRALLRNVPTIRRGRPRGKPTRR